MLQIKNITFRYKKHNILNNVSFNVNQGEHFSIIGESGSGKSTLLKLLYGTYDLNEGEIFWKDSQILGPKYNLIIGPKYMKYVTQEFDLMPFTTVFENIGEFLSNFYPEEKTLRVNELLDVVQLTPLSKTKVKELSGGQKQRVALARAIAKQPEIILLDEPFSHIDNFKKQSLRRSLFKYLKEKKITCIVATHDKNDVLPFSDRMIVLNDARIVAYDNPESLYNNPKLPLIASFFGEFNEINNLIVYAHQLKLVKTSNLQATVIKSYFQGNRFLIEGEIDTKKVFFYNQYKMKTNTIVFLEIT